VSRKGGQVTPNAVNITNICQDGIEEIDMGLVGIIIVVIVGMHQCWMGMGMPACAMSAMSLSNFKITILPLELGPPLIQNSQSGNFQHNQYAAG